MEADYIATLSPEELEQKKEEARQAMALPQAIPTGKNEAVVRPVTAIENTAQKLFLDQEKNTTQTTAIPVFETLAEEALAKSKKRAATFFISPEIPPEKTPKISPEQTIETKNTEIVPPFKAEGQSLAPQEKSLVTEWTEEENKKLIRSRERRLFVLLGAVLLLLLGIFILVMTLFRKNTDAPIPPTIERFTNVLTPDTENTVTINKTNARELIKKTEEETPLEKSKIRRIVPLTTGKDGKTTEMGTALFFDYMGILLPENISRGVVNRFVYGQYQDETPVSFLVLKIEKGEVSYQNAFIGMGAWEKTMPSDLTNLLSITKIAQNPTWEDSSVRNIPIRAFGEPNDPLILWGFIDKETVLITTNTNAFGAIVERLAKGSS